MSRQQVNPQQIPQNDTNLSHGWLQRTAVNEEAQKEIKSSVVEESGLNRSFVNVPVSGNRLPVIQPKLTISDIGNTSSQPQEQRHKTGLPNHLKTGIENLSGYSMDDVKVHYNSQKPAQLQAHAYAQGTEIHVAPGQEKHLPHEAWHLVEQKQGRVQPTMQMMGKVNLNDDVGLLTSCT